MKFKLSLLIFFLNINFSYTQSYDKYLFSSEIEESFKKDTTARNYQHYAIKYANIGDYKNTLRLEEEFVLNFKGLNHKKVNMNADFKNYKPFLALNEIVKQADKRQIVIINEAHFSAQNRVFTQLVLEKLKEKGFKTLFAETLFPEKSSKSDTLLNERKYPLTSTGYYLKEPQYGNMIRKALQLNYQVLSYEFIPNETIKNPIERWSAREKGQANNILKYLKKNPKAKIIIHCGYGHLAEKMHKDDFGMMGAVLKQKSGIDPFTIMQTNWLETLSKKTINPYRKFIELNPPANSSVFKNSDGHFFSADKENYDVQVYFPKTNYINGRPDWLMMIKSRRYLKIPFEKINIKFPYLVFAYHKNEDIEKATAADIIEIKNKNDKKVLVLEKGSYTIVIKNLNGNTQKMELKVD